MRPIATAPGVDMTQRLNDNLACLNRRMEALEAELKRLVTGAATRLPGAESVGPVIAASDTFVHSGLSFKVKRVFFAEGKRNLVADLLLANTTLDDIAVTLNPNFTRFLVAGNSSSLTVGRVEGMPVCAADAGTCFNNPDVHFILRAGLANTVRLVSSSVDRMEGDRVSFSLRIAIKRGREVTQLPEVAFDEIRIE